MSRISVRRGGARGKSPTKSFSSKDKFARFSTIPEKLILGNRDVMTSFLLSDAIDKIDGGEGFMGDPQKKRKGGVVRCVDKSDKPQKIKKTKKIVKRGQRGVGVAKRGFGRAVV